MPVLLPSVVLFMTQSIDSKKRKEEVNSGGYLIPFGGHLIPLIME